MDIRTIINTRDSISFPNTVYADFVKLILKHHLSDTAGNDIIKFFNQYSMRDDCPLLPNTCVARSLVDSMDVPHILYQKTPIMHYKNATYFLYYQLILDTIKELLMKKDIYDSCVFEYHPETNDNGERVYGE